MDKAEAIKLVKRYKEIIMPRFNNEAQVYMFGSYSKGNQRPESDIDVAVVVPTIGDNWFAYTKSLWHDVDKVSLLIEPYWSRNRIRHRFTMTLCAPVSPFNSHTN